MLEERPDTADAGRLGKFSDFERVKLLERRPDTADTGINNSFWRPTRAGADAGRLVKPFGDTSFKGADRETTENDPDFDGVRDDDLVDTTENDLEFDDGRDNGLVDDGRDDGLVDDWLI